MQELGQRYAEELAELRQNNKTLISHLTIIAKEVLQGPSGDEAALAVAQALERHILSARETRPLHSTRRRATCVRRAAGAARACARSLCIPCRGFSPAAAATRRGVPPPRAQTKPEYKLPALYLADSIVKNFPGSVYVSYFERVLPALYGCYGMVDIETIDQVLKKPAKKHRH